MFEPYLKISGTGLDQAARRETICGEPDDGGPVEIVQYGEAVFSAGPEEYMRSLHVSELEIRYAAEYLRGREGIHAGKHAAFTQDADVIQRRIDGGKGPANGLFCLIHGCTWLLSANDKK